MTARKKDNRKKSVVDVHVQWTLAFRVMLHFFAFVCAGAVFGLINQFFANPFGGISQNLWTFWHQSAPIFLALICLMPIFVRDTLTLSNRIAGPIYNMKDKMRRLADGEEGVPELRFRKNDMWSELPELFNAMTHRLQNDQPANVVPPRNEQSVPVVAESEQVPVLS